MSRAVPVCPHCARPDEEPLVCDRCAWRWYTNPRPAAAVLLERPATDGADAADAADGAEPEVLLLRRAVEPGLGGWDLPAGYLDPGESFEQAAIREAREESGLEVELVSLAGVYHSAPANAVTAVFRARALDPEAPVRLDFESSDHAWVARSEAGDWTARMAFRSMAQALGDWGRAVSE